MTASTPVYGFPFEVPGDRPGVTLSGGPTGNESDILAEEVETELERVEGDVANLDNRVTAAEFGWRPISEGTHSGSAFTVAVPSGVYSRLRLTLRGNLDGVGTVRLRINEDSTAELHRSNMIQIDANTPPNLTRPIAFNDSTTFILARWNTFRSSAMCELLGTGSSSFVEFEGSGGAGGTTEGAFLRSFSHGRLTATRLVTGLNLRPFSDASNQFSALQYWLEGYRSP